MGSDGRDRDALGLPADLEPMARRLVLAEVLGPPRSRAKRVVARPAGPLQVPRRAPSVPKTDGSEG